MIENLYNKVLAGETATTFDKKVYVALCEMLEENNIDFVSGDIDPKYPNEPYYVELN